MKGMILTALACLGTSGLWAANDHSVQGQPEPASGNSQAQPTAWTLHRTPAELIEVGGSVSFGPSALELHLHGFAPGRYWVSVVLQADGSILPLGAITILDPTLAPDDEAHENSKQPSSAYQTDVLENTSLVPLPPGLDPSGIAGIAVADSGGVVLLTAGWTPLWPGRF